MRWLGSNIVTFTFLLLLSLGACRCTRVLADPRYASFRVILLAHVEVDPNLLNPPPAASTSSTPSTPSFSLGGSNNSTTSTSTPPPPKRRKHLLSPTSDPLFLVLRDSNFAIVGSILNRTARRLNEDYEKRHLAKTPGELRAFVGTLGGLQNEHTMLRLHTSLTEEVMKVTSTKEFNEALEVQQSTSLSLLLSLLS